MRRAAQLLLLLARAGGATVQDAGQPSAQGLAPTLSVRIDSGSLLVDGGWLTAEWRGVPKSGAEGDPQVWLGVFSSPDANLTAITDDANPVFHTECARGSPHTHPRHPPRPSPTPLHCSPS